MDDDGSKGLSFDEFSKGLKDYGVSVDVKKFSNYLT